jgi:acetoin utilization deacetylase AcuC-like enzyme
VLLVADASEFAGHDTGRGHPERAARLGAVSDGVDASGARDAVVTLAPREATDDELARVHDRSTLEAVEELCRRGGGAIDVDTTVGPGSWHAARLAAGAGLAAVDALSRGEGTAAFLGLRPPGHHATGHRAMGFCLVNNVAVTAAALADAGERVCIVDYDAHHGNGTQEIFYADPRVLYVSLHEWPLYPGTGRLDETGAGAGIGTTCNLPLPAGATGDVYLRAFDEVIDPLVERFAPAWVLVSAGFDAHRADPLTGLELSAGDYGELARRVVALAPSANRVVTFLEGGYDLDALRDSVAATVPALLEDQRRPAERATTGGPGATVVEAVRHAWRDHLA